MHSIALVVPVVLHIVECGRGDCFQVIGEQVIELLQTYTSQASFHLE